MRVSVIGLGYVGLVTAACLAEWGHDVLGVDADESRLEGLGEGRLPVRGFSNDAPGTRRRIVR